MCWGQWGNTCWKVGLKKSHISQHELYIMSGRTIYERSHGQTIFMVGITKQCSHEKEAEWFYSKEKR